MSLLEKLCKEIGVEVGEEWLGNDGKTYIIEKESIIEYYEPVNYNNSDSEDYASWVLSGYEVYADILQGRLKPTTKPKKEEIYYIPDITTPKLYHAMMWMDVEEDIEFYEKGLVFKTKEEAANMAREAMQFIREERLNGRD